MKKAITFSLSLMLSACGAGNGDFGGGPTATTATKTTVNANADVHVIVYSVDGPISQALVVYQNDQGSMSQETVSVPWQKQLVAKPGQLLSLSAQNQDSAGYLTVEIAIDGTIYKQATVFGTFAIASSSGFCC
jgi:hypothetical protein